MLYIRIGLLFLHGTTDYGDAVEDEWLIVYLLRELTLSHPNLWVRVLDTDGEFLLVEAANVLPKWLSPETDRNRTWIHAGKLLIIPSSSSSSAATAGEDDRRQQQQNLSLPDAVAFIEAKPDDLIHSPFVESEAFYRLEKYPAQVPASLHHSLLTLPRRLAHVLRALPRSVAPAVEAFYLRDAAALRPLLSPSAPLAFPPEDLVTVSVRFSKVLYAQLRSQRFEAPPRWQAALDNARREAPSSSSSSVPADADERARRAEAGMKLTCGFEMLSAKASQSKSRVVRELALTLEDLDEDGPGALPSDADIRAWPGADRNDSEAWLDINYEDFERELEGKRTGARSGGGGSSKPAGGFGDTQQQEHLRKIVSRFEAFLNDDTAGLDGAQLEDMDVDDDDDDEDDDWDSDEDSGAEDKEVSFDEDEFARMMREMMGLPSSSATAAAPKAAAPAAQKPTAGNQEDEAIRQLTSQFEAELTSHGALTLDPPEQAGQAKIKGKGRDYGSSKKIKEEGQTQKRSGNDDDDDDDDDTDGEVNIDYNLAKNLLESFKSQGGMPGPTGNLLGMMGLQLPRDEDYGEDDDDDDDGQGQPGPSSKK